MYEERFRHHKECGTFEEDQKVCVAEKLCFVEVSMWVSWSLSDFDYSFKIIFV